jgi:hypothetical protein
MDLFRISDFEFLCPFHFLAPPSTEFILSAVEGLRTCFAPLRES